MAKRESRPSWFKMFLHQKALIDAVPDGTAGKALKAVFQYFDTGDITELDPMAFAVFSAIKPYVDESYDDFKRKSEANKKNVEERWRKNNTTCTSGTNCINSIHDNTINTEADAEAEEGKMDNVDMDNGLTFTSQPQRTIPYSDDPDFEKLKREKLEAFHKAFEGR